MTDAMRLAHVPTLSDIREFYEAKAAEPGYQERMYQHPVQKERMRRTKEILSIILPFAPNVLELGCADGLYSRWIAERCTYLVSVDIAEPCIERCKQLEIPNAFFLCDTLPGVSVTGFDLAIASEVLEHVLNPEETVQRLRGMAKGIFASVPINEKPNARAFSLEAYHNPRQCGDGTGHISSFRPDTFRALFNEVWHYEDDGVTALVVGR